MITTRAHESDLRPHIDLLRCELALERRHGVSAICDGSFDHGGAQPRAEAGQRLAGHYVLATSLPTTQTSAARIVNSYRQLAQIRHITLDTQDNEATVVTRRTPLQGRILTALDIDTNTWDRAHIV